MNKISKTALIIFGFFIMTILVYATTYIDANVITTTNITASYFCNATNSCYTIAQFLNDTNTPYSDTWINGTIDTKISTGITSNITSANNSMKNYVDATNISMKEYVDSVAADTDSWWPINETSLFNNSNTLKLNDSFYDTKWAKITDVTTWFTGNNSLTDTKITDNVTAVYTLVGTQITSNITSENLSMKNYVDATNISMKAYVDALPTGGNASFNQSLTDTLYYALANPFNFINSSSVGYNKTSWDTAFSWGDHNAAGYCTSANGLCNQSFTDTNRTDQEIIDIINQSNVIINCNFINFSGTLGSATICDGDDAAGGAAAGDKWVDAGTFIYPNSTYADNVNVFGTLNASVLQVNDENVCTSSNGYCNQSVTTYTNSSFDLSQIPNSGNVSLQKNGLNNFTYLYSNQLFNTGDDFVEISKTGDDSVFLWYPKKAALFIGEITESFNASTLGGASLSVGLDTYATGYGSTALGEAVHVKGQDSFGSGARVTSSGNYDFSFGWYLNNTYDTSILFGNGVGINDRLYPSSAKSFNIGFDETSPTFVVKQDYVNVFGTLNASILQVNTENVCTSSNGLCNQSLTDTNETTRVNLLVSQVASMENLSTSTIDSWISGNETEINALTDTKINGNVTAIHTLVDAEINANITSQNATMKDYVDATNISMKDYVDSVAADTNETTRVNSLIASNFYNASRINETAFVDLNGFLNPNSTWFNLNYVTYTAMSNSISGNNTQTMNWIDLNITASNTLTDTKINQNVSAIHTSVDNQINSNISLVDTKITDNMSLTVQNGSSVNISNLIISSLSNCDTINTTADGTLICGTDASGSGTFTYADHFDQYLNKSSEVEFNRVNITGNNMSIGFPASGENIYIYFNDDAYNDEYIRWEDGSDRFEISDELYVTGYLEGNYFISLGDIYTTGSGDDLFLGNDVQGDSNFIAYASGDLNMTGHLTLGGNNTQGQANSYWNGTCYIMENRATNNKIELC